MRLRFDVPGGCRSKTGGLYTYGRPEVTMDDGEEEGQSMVAATAQHEVICHGKFNREGGRNISEGAYKVPDQRRSSCRQKIFPSQNKVQSIPLFQVCEVARCPVDPAHNSAKR